MKPLFTLLLLPTILFLNAQKMDSTILIQNAKLTNVDKEDIAEINDARKLVIKNVIAEANDPKSRLHKFLLEDYDDPLNNNGHNNSKKREIYYPNKISKNNFYSTFIEKENSLSERYSKATYNTDTLNNKWTEEKDYTFLITFPYYDGFHRGYAYYSFNYLVKFAIIENWQTDINDKRINIKTQTIFQPYKRIKINYDGY